MGLSAARRSLTMATMGGAFLAALTVIPAPATDQLTGAETDLGGFSVRHDGDWIIYEGGTPNLDTGTARIELIQGKQTGDGWCQMEQSASSETHVPGVQGVEVAFNPTTCESKYLVSELSPEQVDSIQNDTPREQPATPIDRDDLSADHGHGIQPAATKSGWVQSWYEDPPGWDVTYTFVRTTWNYNGSCVTGASGAQEHRHMTQTGWQLYTYDWQNNYSCTKSSSNMFAAYYNDPFCPGGNNTTHNTYNRTRVEGKANGSTYWAWPASKHGGCHTLLRHRYIIGN